MTHQGFEHVQQFANDNGSQRSAPAKSCPICGKPADTATRPFCSKRCADVDLHRWLGGAYAIPVADGDETVPDDEPVDR